MSRAVVLARFSSLEEALVVRALLDANGHDAWLENRHHAAADSFLIPGLGGIGLVCRQDDLQSIAELLREARTSGESEGSGRDDWTRFTAWVALAIFVGIPVFFYGIWGLTILAANHYADFGTMLPWWMVYAPNEPGIYNSDAGGGGVDLASSPATLFLLLPMLFLTLVDAWKPMTGKTWRWKDNGTQTRMFDL
jgi:hypothetical protein